MAGRQSKLTAKRKGTIIELLSKGATDKDTCASVGIDEATFYRWLREGKDNLSPSKSEFYHDVTRARADARLLATESVRLGMMPSQVTVDATETIRETRLNRNGQPYTYERTETKRQITHQPGDWRAGIEYLKRRDPDHWSEKMVISLSSEVKEALRILGMQPSEAVDEFVSILLEAAQKAENGNSTL